MEKLAIQIQPVRVSAKTAGFSAAVTPRPVTLPEEGEGKDENEDALVR
jgi:hypothetical protein